MTVDGKAGRVTGLVPPSSLVVACTDGSVVERDYRDVQRGHPPPTFETPQAALTSLMPGVLEGTVSAVHRCLPGMGRVDVVVTVALRNKQGEGLAMQTASTFSSRLTAEVLRCNLQQLEAEGPATIVPLKDQPT
jgi:hypothetical protein